MDINQIRELIELIDKSSIEEIEIERSGVRVRIRRQTVGAETVLAAPSMERPSVPEPQTPAPEPESSNFIQKSPLVGTFFSSPKPGDDPFVKVGDKVSRGTVLCIVEAMKHLNHIESEVDGEIVKVIVENEQPVEYGEPLFEIRTPS